MSFGSRVAAQTSWTGNRREFIGRNGTLAEPAALSNSAPLSKTVGAGLDPCAALRASVELSPGETVEVIFILGEAQSADAARGLVTRYRAADLDLMAGFPNPPSMKVVSLAARSSRFNSWSLPRFRSHPIQRDSDSFQTRRRCRRRKRAPPGAGP